MPQDRAIRKKMPMPIRRYTRPVNAGDLQIGGGAPISVQSMCATRTTDIEKTLEQIHVLQEQGADIIRVAIDTRRDVEALAQIRKRVQARLAVDLQENYRLIESVAPYVQKVRYNPGHLHHHEKNIPVRQKVSLIVETAKRHGLAVRIGINAGSIDPSHKRSSEPRSKSAIDSAREHVGLMQDLAFSNFVVSLKSSDPGEVIGMNTEFAEEFPDIPLHLGVTEAGMLPEGEAKTRAAFEPLLTKGIGETLRVSLTLPNSEKFREITIGRKIIADVNEGRIGMCNSHAQKKLNIISCPSCSRVENETFVELARKVANIAEFAQQEALTIAVMGCRVNGPGESDDADLGLWCAADHVNLKRRGVLVGSFSYEQILPKVEQELRALIASIGNQPK